MIEAMKQALEALQGSGYYDTTQQREAITSLRQAIAEAEKQKSVLLDNDPEKHPQFYTWTWDEWMRGGEWRAEYGWKKPERKVTNLKPLYTHPYVPTERQPKVEQEPVAMLNRCADEKLQIVSDYDRNRSIWELSIGEPHKVYTHPQPKREPLTDEQLQAIAKEHITVGTRSFEEFARRIEAAHGIK
ncbi:MAG: hypothetical protein RL441_1483 [Actinomycetota bacterium]|jgi:hypothetical protein